mmetsp:Transcript_32782/g.102918  ORF Transcript_32782/g.102918 Transcript_32782/m.102918 type:complete len:80 (+) Transcript_32782:2-241(+)
MPPPAHTKHTHTAPRHDTPFFDVTLWRSSGAAAKTNSDTGGRHEAGEGDKGKARQEMCTLRAHTNAQGYYLGSRVVVMG